MLCSMSEPDWRKLKLSLERPYTDDDGQPIPILYDITPEGRLIYEPYVFFDLSPYTCPESGY
jgi:hypothetical protein